MAIDFPLHFDQRGHTAVTSEADHIRNLIEQVLFTSPGERVNRPTFGSDVLQLVFAPNSDTVAAATQFTIQGALQQWLGDLIEIGEVTADHADSTLQVVIEYTIRRTQQRQVSQFTREV